MARVLIVDKEFSKLAREALAHGVAAAGTAFYMWRLYFLVFGGEERLVGDVSLVSQRLQVSLEVGVADDADVGTAGEEVGPAHRTLGYRALDDDDLLLIVRRVEALGKFLDTEDGKNLLVAYGRAANIVRAEEKKDKALAAKIAAESARQKSTSNPDHLPALSGAKKPAKFSPTPQLTKPRSRTLSSVWPRMPA